MYGHPNRPDPYDDSDPTGFTTACLVVAVPVFAFAFALGYMGGVWGWF